MAATGEPLHLSDSDRFRVRPAKHEDAPAMAEVFFRSKSTYLTMSLLESLVKRLGIHTNDRFQCPLLPILHSRQPSDPGLVGGILENWDRQ